MLWFAFILYVRFLHKAVAPSGAAIYIMFVFYLSEIFFENQKTNNIFVTKKTSYENNIIRSYKKLH